MRSGGSADQFRRSQGWRRTERPQQQQQQQQQQEEEEQEQEQSTRTTTMTTTKATRTTRRRIRRIRRIRRTTTTRRRTGTIRKTITRTTTVTTATARETGTVTATGEAQSATRCLLKWLETSCKPWLCLPFCAASFQLACCVLQLAVVLHSWSKDPVAGPKHHGSEGRIGPAASSPECQMLPSEVTGN